MTTSKASAASPSPAAVASASPPAAPASTRKAWIKKTPVEIVLEQIGKQEEKVAGMRKDLAKEEKELTKLQQAKKVLEG